MDIDKNNNLEKYKNGINELISTINNFNFEGNENIVYEFIFSDNNIVKAGEEKTFNLKVSYTKEVERFMFRSGKYDASLNEPLVLSDKIIGVPDTMKNLGILGLFLLVIVIACLFIGINSIFKIKYGSYTRNICLVYQFEHNKSFFILR